MSQINVWIHMVFSTKKRTPFLVSSIRKAVFQHIFQYAQSKDIEVDFVNGYVDHVHCLFRLNTTITLSKTAQLLKGESSHWINQLELTESRFEWQNDYYAVSVSPDRLIAVRTYIKNQEEHHTSMNFDDELLKFGFTQFID
jgi:putative transposase